MILGTVMKGVGGLFKVRLDQEYEGEKYVNVRGRGSFRYEKTLLLAGDRVELECVGQGEFFCKRILERKNSLIRPPLSNLDYIFVVISSKKPTPSLFIVDKLISIAEYNKIEPIIVISKSDLDSTYSEEISKIYKNSGFEVFVTSSVNNEGVDELLGFLRKITSENEPICAFAGASGAGKSTLMNTLFSSLALQTGNLSEKIERGKNTTRHTELFPFSELLGEEYNGYLADTPGFSLLDFERFDFFSLEDLFDTFRDFKDSVGKCKYTKCTHTKEDGCDVVSRVKNGEIEKSRHESYIELFTTLKNKPKWK